jgi:hypothetical protein
VIEVSDNGSNWDEVDRRENNSSLKGRNLTNLFQISRTAECRFIRLRQIGKTHDPNPEDCLIISGFEIFGQLIEVWHYHFE